MSIDAAFFGFLAADAVPRTSQAGKPWVRLRVGVGKDDALQWVMVAVFGKAAAAAAELKKGDRCYVEGALKLDTWHGNDGAERHGLNVAAFRCDPTHRIGRKRRRGRARRLRLTMKLGFEAAGCLLASTSRQSTKSPAAGSASLMRRVRCAVRRSASRVGGMGAAALPS